MRTLFAVAVLTCSMALAEEGRDEAGFQRWTPQPGQERREEQTGAAPKVVQGRPVLGMALLDGKVVQVVAYDDGTWVDPEDLYEVEKSVLISDPTRKPLQVTGGWFQPIRASYRGSEGWQALKWGMTQAEVRKAMGNASTAKAIFTGGLAFHWELGGQPSVVNCVFVQDRLAGVLLYAIGTSFDRVHSLLEAKLGEPTERELLRSKWESGESIVTLSLRALVPMVVYASRAFGPLFAEQMKQADKKQADREL